MKMVRKMRTLGTHWLRSHVDGWWKRDARGESFRETGRDGGSGEQVSQVVYINPVCILSPLSLSLAVCLGGCWGVTTVVALDPVNTDTVSRVSFFKQTHASCYQRVCDCSHCSLLRSADSQRSTRVRKFASSICLRTLQKYDFSDGNSLNTPDHRGYNIVHSSYR